MPMLADMLLSEFSDELVWLFVELWLLGFKDRFKGPSARGSGAPYEGTLRPDGLPFVGGNLMTSTRSEDEVGVIRPSSCKAISVLNLLN